MEEDQILHTIIKFFGGLSEGGLRISNISRKQGYVWIVIYSVPDKTLIQSLELVLGFDYQYYKQKICSITFYKTQDLLKTYLRHLYDYHTYDITHFNSIFSSRCTSNLAHFQLQLSFPTRGVCNIQSDAFNIFCITPDKFRFKTQNKSCSL